MKRVSITWRVVAAFAAFGATASIVWGMSSYAYPLAPEYQVGEMAHVQHWASCPS